MDDERQVSSSGYYQEERDAMALKTGHISMAVDSHDDVKPKSYAENVEALGGKYRSLNKVIGPSKVDRLIDGLAQAYKDHDDVYMEIVDGAKVSGEKYTESKLAVAVRDEMRRRGMKHPAIVLWQLRAALGGVESHGE